jgi:hypothetical protein
MRVFVLMIAFGFACGGDSSGPPTVAPNALVRVAGDSQAALTGTPLPTPLRVRVNGSNSQPYGGATVTWTVLTGTATLGTPSVTSDSQGFASTTVTLGATPGALAIQASVAGVTPVSFGAKACDHPVFAFNDTVPGALATTDCRFGGFYTDFFDLNVPTGPQGLVLTMESLAFDTFLELYLPSGNRSGFDDDIDTSNTNSQLTAIVAPGDYLIAPSSFDLFTIGAYTLSVITQPPALAGCGLVWVTRGVTVSDSVTTGDCVDSTGGRFYADAVALDLVAGTVLRVSLHSAAFDAALFLHNQAGTQVLANNDSAGGTTNAFLAYPVAATGPYLLFVGTNDSLATGAYTLSVSAATTLSASRDGAGGGRHLLPLGAMRLPKGLPQRAWRH